ncbi:SAF domain-containing protein [Nocardiopsis sp. EMB25]|uniref:SAF domain-containing protein n=1 Tax=Nocardiopsis sp. EMB25 TaxID=2835867 RepID=UPI002284EB88|nr:SAF domain-containing protein [Nocardiopsis sp. EMB25]
MLDDARPVAVLAADLPAGHVLTASDVRSVEVAEADGVRMLSPQEVEGQVLTRPTLAGSLLVDGSVGDRVVWPDLGQAVVAVPVSTVPQGLEAGATVDVVTPTGGDGDADGPLRAVTGSVHRVVPDEDTLGAGQQVVEVVMSRNQATYVSRAVAQAPAQLLVLNPHDDARAVAVMGGGE